MDAVRQRMEEHSATDPASAVRLFRFEGTPPALVRDELVATCQDADPKVAHQLLWVARLWADHRLAAAMEAITDRQGKLIPERVNKPSVEQALQPFLGSDAKGLGKSASNVLGYLEQAHIINPLKEGSSITGMSTALPTSSVVPHLLRFLQERLDSLKLAPPEGSDPVDLALGLGLNHWVNLTPDEFRRAAALTPPATAVSRRGRLDGQLLLVIDNELRRRGQVVLQGPPGVGKTHEAMRYVDWATAERRTDGHVQRILDQLPSHERTPARVADEVIRLGLPAAWDIVQFHPSYGYEDFVRTLAPRPGPSGVTFVAEHRALSFLAAVGHALTARGSEADLVLVVDEINRADISRVFGELLYGLEYRGQPVATPHQVDGTASLAIPPNLFLIGTMNTADRSIALIDYALRRRFTFIDVRPDRAAIAHAAWPTPTQRDAALRLYDLAAALFDPTDPNAASLTVGHSYFLPGSGYRDPDEALIELSRRFAYETFSLLQEYAAEGLLDQELVSSVAAELGFTPADGQEKAADATLMWLLTASAPAAPES